MKFTSVLRTRAALLAASAILVAGLGTAAPATASPADTRTARLDLARAYAGTARYHYEPFAIADGYLRAGDDECVEVPGLGAMGIHYVNPQRLGRMDPSRPDTLLYAPGPNGRPQLVAVEFFHADADGDLGTDNDRPSMFGRVFDGPMPGHFPGQPVHYDLHVWLWRYNPAGMFAPFNPSLSCG